MTVTEARREGFRQKRNRKDNLPEVLLLPVLEPKPPNPDDCWLLFDWPKPPKPPPKLMLGRARQPRWRREEVEGYSSRDGDREGLQRVSRGYVKTRLVAQMRAIGEFDRIRIRISSRGTFGDAVAKRGRDVEEGRETEGNDKERKTRRQRMGETIEGKEINREKERLRSHPGATGGCSSSMWSSRGGARSRSS